MSPPNSGSNPEVSVIISLNDIRQYVNGEPAPGIPVLTNEEITAAEQELKKAEEEERREREAREKERKEGR